MKTLFLSASLTAFFLMGACATKPPEPITVENMQTLTATVQSVDLEHRLVSLTAANGHAALVEAGPEVENLAQVKAGDKVVVRYYEAIAAEFKEKGTSSTLGKVDRTGGTARAEPGEKPGAAAGATVTTTVVIDSVDQPSNTVAFKGPNGVLRSVEVKDAKARKFVQGLKPGDEVEVTYTEALAVAVEPAQ